MDPSEPLVRLAGGGGWREPAPHLLYLQQCTHCPRSSLNVQSDPPTPEVPLVLKKARCPLQKCHSHTTETSTACEPLQPLRKPAFSISLKFLKGRNLTTSFSESPQDASSLLPSSGRLLTGPPKKLPFLPFPHTDCLVPGADARRSYLEKKYSGFMGKI